MRTILAVLLVLSLAGLGRAELRILGEESPPGEYLDPDDSVIEKWQAALEEAKADGTLAAIYHGTYPEETIRAVSLPGDPLVKGEYLRGPQ